MDIYERAMLLRLMVDIAEQTLCAMFIFSFFFLHRIAVVHWLGYLPVIVSAAATELHGEGVL